MPYRKILKDIKIAAMHLYEDDILSKPAILDYLRISSWTFDCVLALWNATGEVVKETNGVHGRPCIPHFSDVEYLKHLIRHHPDWFLDELQYLLQTNCFIAAHFTTVHRELIQAGISAKKIKKVASDCNEDLWTDFVTHMAPYSPEQLGFLNEVLKDECTALRTHGRSWKGTWAVMKGAFVCGWCFSAEGLLSVEWLQLLLSKCQWCKLCFLSTLNSLWYIKHTASTVIIVYRWGRCHCVHHFLESECLGYG